MGEEECDFDKLFYIRLWADMSPTATEKEKLKRIEPERNDFHNFNRVRINYLVKKGITPVMVWDNLDHAPLEVQRRAIQLARHKLSWMPGAKVIIAIREHTYPLVQQEIAPAAYLLSGQEVFAPDVHSLLERRVDTSAKMLRGAQPAIHVGDKYSIVLARPECFLRIVLQSLKQPDVEKALCQLSEDNARLQLLMAQRTFRSGHIPIEMISDMVESYTGMGDYVPLSWRRFMQGLICGDYLYHRTVGDDASLVLNTFECGDLTHGFANSLCMPRLLLMLDRFTFDNVLADLLGILEVMGYPSATLRQGVALLMHTHLIQSPQGPLPAVFLNGDPLPKPYLVSSTAAGRYYLRRLMLELVYVQHMAVVTSLEAKWHERIRLWKPKDIQVGAEAAAALIGQIHDDERRELTALSKCPEGPPVAREYAFGRLAHDMAHGCRAAVNFMQRAWIKRGTADVVNWDAIRSTLRPPDILTP